MTGRRADMNIQIQPLRQSEPDGLQEHLEQTSFQPQNLKLKIKDKTVKVLLLGSVQFSASMLKATPLKSAV